MAEKHQTVERRIKYTLVALRTPHACTPTCHLCEVELVAQPLCEAWSVWLPRCSLAPRKERLGLALADEDGSDISDKMGSMKPCMKVLLGQPTMLQSLSPWQPSWLGGNHQHATAACKVSELQQILYTWQIFALFISACNQIKNPLDHKDCTGLKNKKAK